MQDSLRYLMYCLLITSIFIACQSSPPFEENQTVGSSNLPIIGGTPDLRHPAVGALTNNKRKFCTGTLITPQLVLTAAHCITAAQGYKARGAKIEFRIDLPAGTSYRSSYYAAAVLAHHPQYKKVRTLYNDIGYLALSSSVTGVTPIGVSTTKMDSTWRGRKVLFLGYGVIRTTPSRISPKQKYGAEIPIQNVQSDRFSVYKKGTSICSGDSGGPGLYMLNGSLKVIGVNSYVPNLRCDSAGYLFRIDIFQKWLQPIIGKYGGTCKVDTDCGPCYKCNKTKGKCALKGTKPSNKLCKPCSSPSDCGGTGNICVRQAEGNRCMQACDKNLCCPIGYSCQKVGASPQQCVPDANKCAAITCLKDQDCGPGESCQNGTCKPKPLAPSAQLCKKCNIDSDCVQGKCLQIGGAKYCSMPCAGGNFCPRGYGCKDIAGTRQCLPAAKFCRCQSDTECHTGDTCQSGKCNKPGGGKEGDSCSPQRKCANGYACTPSQKGSTCIQKCSGIYPSGSPGSFCRGNSCASGAKCYGVQGKGRVCLTPCTSSTSCNNGGTCSALGRTKFCVCRSDSDCKNGTSCNKTVIGSYGFCTQKSTGRIKCKQGFTCTVAGAGSLCLPKGTRIPGQTCDQVNRCVDGSICGRSRSGKSYCIRSCSSSCHPGGGKCTRTNVGNICLCTSSCSRGYSCKKVFGSSGVCTKNAGTPSGCLSDLNCPPEQRCVDGKCQKKPTQPKCKVNTDCEANELCRQGKCLKYLESCRSDVDCSQNQQCINDKCTPNQKQEAKVEPPAQDTNTADASTSPDTSTPKEAKEDSNKPENKKKDKVALIMAGGCACSQTNEQSPVHSLLFYLFFIPLLFFRSQRKKKDKRT